MPTSQGELSIHLALQSIAVGGTVVNIGPFINTTGYGGILAVPGLAANGSSLASPAGRPITLQLSSNTSHAAISDAGADGWMVSMFSPGSSMALYLGLMQAAGVDGKQSLWSLTVPGSNLSQVR